MLVVAVCLREIPDRALRLVMTASAQNCRTCMFIDVFIGPLPNISYQVPHAEWTRSLRMSIYIIRWSQHASSIGDGDCRSVPLISPRIPATVGALRGELPFPLVR